MKEEKKGDNEVKLKPTHKTRDSIGMTSPSYC
jgi:hypothetical protein